MNINCYPRTKILGKVLLVVLSAVLAYVSYGVFFGEISPTTRQNLSQEVFPWTRLKRGNYRVSGPARDSDKIPPIIHQTWKSEQLPLIFKPWMISWLKYNPDWELWFWTDADIRKLIKVRFPGFLQQFDQYPPGGFRPDVFRYFVLYEFGGIYADIDMECLRSLDPIRWQHQCIISQEPLEHAVFLAHIKAPLVSNALMGCKPQHDFFKYVINKLSEFLNYAAINDVIGATGPYMLTQVYKDYIKIPDSMFMQHDKIHLAAPEDFHPALDESMLDSMRENCIQHNDSKDNADPEVNVMRRMLCKKLLDISYSNKPAEISYTTHYWTHTWAGPKNDPFNIHNMEASFDIPEILQFFEHE